MMSGVEQVDIGPEDSGMRIDRWLARRFPALNYGRIQKLLRTGQVRVDGGRIKPQFRLETGQRVRLPPVQIDHDRVREKRPRPPDTDLITTLESSILYRDKSVMVIDKPAGLAVQSGSGIDRHIDAWLDTLGSDEARPRLVHRLDKDTSGVLALALNANAARALTAAFRSRRTYKEYWALTVGVPEPESGRIDAPLLKGGPAGKERVHIDDQDGRKALTQYHVLDHAGKAAALVALAPLTGRTHQLRAHMAAIGTPIAGDGKYGGNGARLPVEGVERKLHLHARRLVLPHPSGGGRPIDVTAPLPAAMRNSLALLGLEARLVDEPFPDLLDAALKGR